jgi:hypothetical protein
MYLVLCLNGHVGPQPLSFPQMDVPTTIKTFTGRLMKKKRNEFIWFFDLEVSNMGRQAFTHCLASDQPPHCQLLQIILWEPIRWKNMSISWRSLLINSAIPICCISKLQYAGCTGVIITKPFRQASGPQSSCSRFLMWALNVTLYVSQLHMKLNHLTKYNQISGFKKKLNHDFELRSVVRSDIGCHTCRRKPLHWTVNRRLWFLYESREKSSRNSTRSPWFTWKMNCTKTNQSRF